MLQLQRFVVRVLISSVAWVALLAANAQDFAPLNANSRKLFSPFFDPTRAYSLAIDSSTTSGGITTLHNFKTVQDTMTASTCPWWGAPECMRQDKSTWFGPRMEVDAQGAVRFFNQWNAAIDVPFQTDPADTAIIYADTQQKFLMVYETEYFQSTLGLVESTRQWRILHRDLFGNVIPSALNDYPVQVGETVGLSRFFRVDSFPLVLEPVQLIGQAEPALGLHVITPALLEDHQPGDEVQVHEYYNLLGGPPWNNHDRYRKRIFLTRADALDFVSYSVREELFDNGGSVLSIDTISALYSTTAVIAEIPFERFVGTTPLLRSVDYCDFPMWTYETFLNQGLAYCADENCWGPFDTNGPPPMGGNTYVLGIGLFDSLNYVFGMYSYTAHDNVVYFKKNGLACSNEIVMGVGTSTTDAVTVSLAPNPTDGLLSINAQLPIRTFELIDVQGRTVFTERLNARNGSMDLSSLPGGLYTARFHFANGSVAVQRVVRY